MNAKIDWTGKRFNRLLLLKCLRRARGKVGSWVYLCRCDCGVEKEIELRHMKSGATQSCGCLSRENASKLLLISAPSILLYLLLL